MDTTEQREVRHHPHGRNGAELTPAERRIAERIEKQRGKEKQPPRRCRLWAGTCLPFILPW